jgi:hypothetical protein
LGSANVYKLYRLSSSTRSSPKSRIMRLGGQIVSSCCFRNSHLLSVFTFQDVTLKIIGTNCLVLNSHYCIFCFSLDVIRFLLSIWLYIDHQNFFCVIIIIIIIIIEFRPPFPWHHPPINHVLRVFQMMNMELGLQMWGQLKELIWRGLGRRVPCKVFVC